MPEIHADVRITQLSGFIGGHRRVIGGIGVHRFSSPQAPVTPYGITPGQERG